MSMHALPELMQINNSDHAALLDLYRKRDTNGAYEKTTAHLQQTLQSIDGRAR